VAGPIWWEHFAHFADEERRCLYIVDMAWEQGTNQVLAGYLTRLGWTTHNLAHHLNALAATLRLPDRVHPKTPRRWMQAIAPRAEPCRPRQPWPGLVCALLSERLHEPVTLAALGWDSGVGSLFVPADHGLDQAWDPAGAVASLREVLDADGMDRRHFWVITGTSLTAFAHAWIFDPARVAAAVQGKRVDYSVVNDLQLVAEARRRLDDVLGGGPALLRTLREDLRLTLEIIDNASYTEEVGKGLYSVAAEFARLAAWTAYDTDQPALAQRFYIAALRTAHSSHDRAQGAFVLGQMSNLAMHGDPRDALRLAESGLTGAKNLDPTTAAYLHARVTTSAATLGNQATSDRARGQMFELTAEQTRKAPGWLYWWDLGCAHDLAGRAALALGNNRQAATHFRDAIASCNPELPRDRSLRLCRLATARARLGELDGACRSATEAAVAAKRLGTERIRTHLVDFRHSVEPHANSTPVKEFDTKFAGFLRATRPN